MADKTALCSHGTDVGSGFYCEKCGEEEMRRPGHITWLKDSDNIADFVLRPTDLERAKAYEHRAREQIEAFCALENEMAADGFVLQYQIGFNGFGRKALQLLAVLKRME